jgi:hypothetical protein
MVIIITALISHYKIKVLIKTGHKERQSVRRHSVCTIKTNLLCLIWISLRVVFPDYHNIRSLIFSGLSQHTIPDTNSWANYNDM